MTLQYSGAISLGQIHGEAQNLNAASLTTLVSISDFDVRDLIDKGLNAQVSFSEFYGVSYDTGGGGQEP